MEKFIDYGNNTLWGVSGGQLEFVSFERTKDTITIKFTDHDVRVAPNSVLKNGKYYELTFPISEEAELFP